MEQENQPAQPTAPPSSVLDEKLAQRKASNQATAAAAGGVANLQTTFDAAAQSPSVSGMNGCVCAEFLVLILPCHACRLMCPPLWMHQESPPHLRQSFLPLFL